MLIIIPIGWIMLSRLYPLYLGQISESEVTYLGLSCLLEKV